MNPKPHFRQGCFGLGDFIVGHGFFRVDYRVLVALAQKQRQIAALRQ
jgi:hypothetical protein